MVARRASSSTGAWTYARAGVDRGPTSRALAALLATARYSAPASSGRPVAMAGHYAGLLKIGDETIAITTDTVGTKTLLAAELDRWEEVGEDVVAVNVNDLAAVGARPAGLVDCISVPNADERVFGAIGRGLARGLRAARCHLLGGETAIVPELLTGTDLGGTAIGFYPKGRNPVTGSDIRVGDVIVGIPSSGLHANGMTLARRLVRERGLALDRLRPKATKPLGEELLTPTRIYVSASEAIADLPGLTGLAHLSGGGVRNLVRLSPGVRFTLDRWPEPPSLFGFLAELGPIEPYELYQTFNMGIGFVALVRPAAVAPLLVRLKRAKVTDARPIGHVTNGRGVELPSLGLAYEGYA
jgi:phosphoribosylformylglycinamidine cyclo-ligase